MDVAYEYRKTLLRIDNVSFSANGKVILRDISAEIKDIVIPGRVTGQVIAIVGLSGCGKTTLFRIIAGLLRPTSGQVVTLDGDTYKPIRVGHVGVVAQNYPLFAHRTVLGNLMIPARAHSSSEAEAKEKVEAGLASFGLQAEANAYSAVLSGGQRQRVAILQMLICREPVILFDEPFSGLDMVAIESAARTITHAANTAEENCFIIVTHDVTAAVAVADHVWVLGRERDRDGNPIPGSRIVETYDLIARGLCYEEGAVTNPRFMETVREIKDKLRNL